MEMLSLQFLLFAALPLLAIVFPLGGQSLPVPNDAIPAPDSPCAEVGSLVLQANSHTVPAELAYECLRSVPLHVGKAKALHDSLVPYLVWHTTFSYVKDPPAKYQIPAYDFWAAFDDIKVKLSNDSYQNEWEFGMDLYRTFNNVHDAHLRYVLDILGKAFIFQRTVSLVSVSWNGYALPQVYVQDDILKWVSAKDVFPSPVVKINGQAVQTYLNIWMQDNSCHDYDAMYNTLFWSVAQDTNDQASGGYTRGFFSGYGMSHYLYPGPSTNLSFDNGTTRTYQNVAKLQANFTDVNDGELFYQKFCTGPTSSNSTTSLNTPRVADRAATPTYPTPIARHPRNRIVGYFLDSPSHDQIAVLSIPDFVGSGPITDPMLFQRTTSRFLRSAKLANKTKLIIDLRGNSGGTILVAFDLFKQLFPQLDPWGGSRFRAHPAFNAVGTQIRVLTDIYNNGTNTSDFHENAATLMQPYSPYLALDASGQNFRDWSSMYGPVLINNDTFTHTLRWNLSSTYLTDESIGINISTYHESNNLPIPIEQPFEAENIILLHDGNCASTCATFSDLMRVQAGVRSVVVGGRPSYKSMQSVSGTRGMEVYSLAFIWKLVQWFGVGDVELGGSGVVNMTLQAVERSAWNNAGARAVNVRDSVLREQEDGVPSQFLHVPADCRLFYTPEMVVDVTRVWERVGDVVWGGEGGEGGKGGGWDRCVVGDL